jgi:hypothetical protein
MRLMRRDLSRNPQLWRSSEGAKRDPLHVLRGDSARYEALRGSSYPSETRLDSPA